MAYTIFFVDADESSAALAAALAAEFHVETFDLAQHAIQSLGRVKPDLIVLDKDLPDMPGTSFLKVLRSTPEWHDIPALLLSDRKTEESVVEAFELGVDDYVLKPVDPRELAVRARAVLRRRFERLDHVAAPLSAGCIEIDPGQRLCLVEGGRVSLQPREFELLEMLMRKAGRILTRRYLLETVWGMAATADTRAVDMMVSRLRKRLGPAGSRHIETVTKLGYVFRK